jgi:dehydrogenase/reductase SDR family protein 7B
LPQLPSVVDKAWTWAGQHGGRISGLVNNAGISQRSLAVETVFDVYQKIVAVDLLAPIALTQALLPRMIKAGGGQYCGHLKRCGSRRRALAHGL